MVLALLSFGVSSNVSAQCSNMSLSSVTPPWNGFEFCTGYNPSAINAPSVNYVGSCLNTPSYNYLWEFRPNFGAWTPVSSGSGVMFVPGYDPPAITNTPAGSAIKIFQWRLTVTDVANGNQIAQSGGYTVFIGSQMTGSATSIPPVCVGQANASIDLTVAGGLSNKTYTWTATGGGGIVPPSEVNVEDPTGLTSGDYQVVVSDGGCTNLTVNVTISAIPLGNVHNITQGTNFCSIQAAINDAATVNGDIITIDPGTYNEQVLIHKSVTLKNSGSSKPIINFTGTPALVSGRLTIFEVTVPNVTIDSLTFNLDVSKVGSAILASDAVNGVSNLTVTDNDFNPYRSSVATVSFGLRNAISVNYGAYRVLPSNPVNSLLVQGNIVTYNIGVDLTPGTSDDAGFRSGVSSDEATGTFTMNTFQSISQDILVRFVNSANNVNITNNNLNGGGVECVAPNIGTGTLNITGNTFDGTFGNTYTSCLRVKDNINASAMATLIQNNTFSNHTWGISLENYKSVTIDNNTFTPLAGSTAFRHITVNTKELNSSSATVTQTALDGTFTNNIFNGSGVAGGKAMVFLNHDSDNDSYGTFTLGTPGNENNFASDLGTFIEFDGSTGASWPSSFPENNVGSTTTMACWDQNLNAENNKFDVGAGLQLPSAMNFAGRTALEAKLDHKPDASCKGQITYFFPVHNLTQNTYFMTIQSSIAAANANDVIECAEWTFNEKVTIDKSLTLQGVSEANTVITGTGLGNGSGITVNNGITNVTIQNLTVKNHTGTSPNLFAGIYAVGGNNGINVQGCTLKDNVGGSGFYANGPVVGVTLNNLDVSGHPATFGAARGIVIWNGLKQNITITNCDVYNNNCCGIELQDGTATNVMMTNNNVHDNGDNGIGAIGLQGPGTNVIGGNTVSNNGRYGIELKNSNGNGAGNIVITSNNVTLTPSVGMNNRDHAGISVYRRAFQPGNPDGYINAPNGVVIANNTISGYTQMNPSSTESEGFGIVIEGTNHIVTNNTISNCNIGVQQQGGAHPNANYVADNAGDGNQADGASPIYFGRGNAPFACGNTITGNIYTANTSNTRNVTTGSFGLVVNTNTNEVFCSIQGAISDAQTVNGHTINVTAGTYSENVIVNKGVTISGPNAAINPCSGIRGAEAIVVPATNAVSSVLQ